MSHIKKDKPLNGEFEQHSETNPPFEDMLKELETLSTLMEQGQLPLDDAIKAYERGMVLRKLCQEKLDQVRAKLDILSAQEKEDKLDQPLL